MAIANLRNLIPFICGDYNTITFFPFPFHLSNLSIYPSIISFKFLALFSLTIATYIYVYIYTYTPKYINTAGYFMVYL